MKKGVLNYSLTWMEDGEKHEEIHFTKMEAVKSYLNFLCGESRNRNISSLTFWECYTTFEKPAKNITSAINKFLEG